MTDRRRAPRYQMCGTTTAQINLLQDVSIQSVQGDSLVVLAPSLPPPSDRLLMQLEGPDGEVASLGADVIRTAPVLQSGVVQFQLELRVAGFAALFGLLPVATLG